MRKHIQPNKDERTQFVRKIYHSIYSKGLCVRGELETEQNCNILTPPNSSGYHSLSVRFFLGCSTGGGLRAQPLLGHSSHSSIFSPTDLNFLSLGLYNNLTPTNFLQVSRFTFSSTPRQSSSPPDIFDRMHLLFTQVHFFF